MASLDSEILEFLRRRGWKYKLTAEYVELDCPANCGGKRNPFAIHRETGGGSCRKCGWRGGLDALKRLTGEPTSMQMTPASPAPKPKATPPDANEWRAPHERLMGNGTVEC